MTGVYYNENDPYCAEWIRNLIAGGELPDGDVDERSIEDVTPADVAGYTQAHWFAGIGGWPLALRLAGWPRDRPIWTGSCPCQRFSSAARGRHSADDLWPEWRRLIVASRPGTIVGEQVAHARRWFDQLCDDVEAMDYSVGASILPSVGVAQDHERARIYFACHADGDGEPIVPVDAEVARLPRTDGEPGGMVSANGVSDDMAAMSAFGNAIVPQLAAQFLTAHMEAA